jgi:hypothetical protein
MLLSVEIAIAASYLVKVRLSPIFFPRVEDAHGQRVVPDFVCCSSF